MNPKKEKLEQDITRLLGEAELASGLNITENLEQMEEDRQRRVRESFAQQSLSAGEWPKDVK